MEPSAPICEVASGIKTTVSAIIVSKKNIHKTGGLNMAHSFLCCNLCV